MYQIKTVLVEDDPMVLHVNTQYIKDIGGYHIIGVAETSEDALRLIQKLKPDLVILDVYLPDQDGIITLQEIRNLNLPTDVILVTAARDAETVQNAFRFGAVDYIIKPFKRERLKSALDTYRLMKQKLSRKTALNQDEIDTLSGTKKIKPCEELLPKGLNELTLKQVVLYLLKQNTLLSAEEVAEGVGIARVTARRYLEYLEKTGRVIIDVQYGSVGRPVNRYRLTS